MYKYEKLVSDPHMGKSWWKVDGGGQLSRQLLKKGANRAQRKDGKATIIAALKEEAS